MSQKYDKDFKIQTVRMIQEQGKPVAQVARERKRQTFPTFNAPQHPCENEGNPLKQEVAS